MKTEFIPKITALFAGAVVCIISIVKHMDTTYSLAILLGVLLGFYIIGNIARVLIEKVIVSNRFVKEEENSQTEDRVEENEEKDTNEEENRS